MNTNNERVVARAAVTLAISEDRESERALKAAYAEQGIRTAAVDVGGEFLKSMHRMVEQAIVAARREGLIEENSPRSDGSIAGALHDALSQVAQKASGLSVGGKIGWRAARITSAWRCSFRSGSCIWTMWRWAWLTA